MTENQATLATQHAAGRAPWLGLCTFLGIPFGMAILQGVQLLDGTPGSGLLIGLLGSAMAGFAAMIGAQLRHERWPWLAMMGTVVSAAPLAVFLGAMAIR